MLAMFADRGKIVLDGASGQQHPKFVSIKHGSQQLFAKGTLPNTRAFPNAYRRVAAQFLRGEIVVMYLGAAGP